MSPGGSEKTFRTWKCALDPNECWLKWETVTNSAVRVWCGICCKHVERLGYAAFAARHSLPALADQLSKEMLWRSICESRLICAPRLWRTDLCHWLIISMIQMCHLNWNITWAVALEVTNINFLTAHFATIYENIISLHVSLTFWTVCQTVLWMSAL